MTVKQLNAYERDPRIVNEAIRLLQQAISDFAYTLLDDQDASDMLNTLGAPDQVVDEYTPVAAFGGDSTGITYGFQGAVSVRTGALVTVHGHVALTSNGTGVGDFSISLPSEAGAEAIGTAVVWESDGTLADTPVFCYVDSGDDFVNFYFQSGTGTDAVDDTMLGDAADVEFYITYILD